MFSKKVSQYSLDGKLIKIWDSMSDVYRELKIPVPNIVRACNSNTRTAKNYIWRYYKKEGD